MYKIVAFIHPEDPDEYVRKRVYQCETADEVMSKADELLDEPDVEVFFVYDQTGAQVFTNTIHI